MSVSKTEDFNLHALQVFPMILCEMFSPFKQSDRYEFLNKNDLKTLKACVITEKRKNTKKIKLIVN